MAKKLDIEWLKNQAIDNKSKQWIQKIIQDRNFVYEQNKFIENDQLFSLNTPKYKLWFRESNAFSTIEVFHEIFREDNHFLLPEFSGKHDHVIVDIGANNGFYTLKIKGNNPNCQVISVEPNPYMFEVLKKNIGSNHLEDVVLVNKAVGPNNETIPFEIIKEIGSIGGKNLRIIERPWLKDEFIEKIDVETITLDRLCQENKIANIDILKIDVEGMELEILKSCKDMLNRIRKVVVERHSRELRNEIVSFLTANHFDLLLEEDPELKQYYGDLYFINKNIA